MRVKKNDVIIKKKDFISEHKKLIKLFNALDREKKDQMKELKELKKKRTKR